MKNVFPRLTLAGALLLPGSISTDSAERLINGRPCNDIVLDCDATPVQLDEDKQYEEAFTVVKKYWLQRKAAIAFTELAFLKADENIVCRIGHQSVVIRGEDISGPQYCTSNNTVIITEMHARTLPAYYVGEELEINPVIEYEVSHELSHSIQDADGTLEFPHDEYLERILSIELQADCYAGMVMAALYPDDIDSTNKYILDVMPPVDIRHGTPGQRSESFLQGALKSICPLITLPAEELPRG